MIIMCPKCKIEHEINKTTTCNGGWRFVFDLPSTTTGHSKSHFMKQGRESWGLLHGQAFIDRKWIESEQSLWFQEVWKPTIPSYGCDCNSEFGKILEVKPPIFLSRVEYYLWTVWAHNEVNRRVKPQQPLWTITNEIDRLKSLEVIHDLQASV